MLDIKKIKEGEPEFVEIENKGFFIKKGKENCPIFEKFCRENGVTVYAAQKDGSVVGFLIANPATDDVVSIFALAVDSEQRGKGIGGALIDRVKADFHPKAIVAETLEEGVGFFEKYGFYVSDFGEKFPGQKEYYVTYRCMY